MSMSPFFCMRVLLMVLVLATVGGCESLRALDEARPPDTEHIVIRPAVQIDIAEPYVDRFALMALFSLTVYREDIDAKQSAQVACSYLGNEAHRYVRRDMPQDTNGGWKRWIEKGACFNEHGLYYETYVYESRAHPDSITLTEAVIAIRGTETGDWNDRKASASGIFDFAETEYFIAQQRIPVLIQALKDAGVKTIYLTGHSLGGGIAQEIAFLSKDVAETFVFNTSPVTNWMRLCKTTTDLNWDPKINRIYQGKEALAYLRNLTSRFNSELYARTDFRFGFVNADVLESHSMNHLACQLSSRVCSYGADHHYSYESAQNTVKDKILCPDSVVEKLPNPAPSCVIGESGIDVQRQTWIQPRSNVPMPEKCTP